MSTNRTYAISSSISFLISEDISVGPRSLRPLITASGCPCRAQMSGLVGCQVALSALSGLERGLHFQPQRVEANEAGRVRLVVGRFTGFHGRDFRIVKAVRTFAAGDDNIAFVKF